jgi:hypothetical protein
MTANEYVKKFEEICKKDFISARDIIRELDITHPTLMRLRKDPALCAMKTMKKVKKFVDDWEAINKGE